MFLIKLKIFAKFKEVLYNYMAMSKTEKALRGIFGLFGDELVERKNPAEKNLDLCNGVATQDDSTNTCALCVAVNHTVYRNANKCNYVHPNCKCNYTFFEGELQTDFPMEKITKYLFVNKDKTKMMHQMGYYVEDSQELHTHINNIVLQSYRMGKYELNYLNDKGQHAEIKLTLKGKRDHIGEFFACHVGCVIYPYGKIKIATPLVED